MGVAELTISIPYQEAKLHKPGLILLVEDTDAIRETIRGHLRNIGHTVIEASNAEEALELVNLDGLSHVVTDLMLGGEMTGLDFANHMRSERPEVPVLIVTGLPESDPIQQSAAAAFPILGKTVFQRATITRHAKGQHMNQSAPLVTILDDTVEIREMLSAALQDAGFRTMTFGRSADFERAISNLNPAVCLVDLGLPDKDGLSLISQLAYDSGAAVVIISGRSMLQDKIVGLDLGADDYITKPFETAEVVARVRALVRRQVSKSKTRRIFGHSLFWLDGRF